MPPPTPPPDDHFFFIRRSWNQTKGDEGGKTPLFPEEMTPWVGIMWSHRLVITAAVLLQYMTEQHIAFKRCKEAHKKYFLSHVSSDEGLNGDWSADRKEGCLRLRLPVLLCDSVSVLVLFFSLHSSRGLLKLPPNRLSVDDLFPELCLLLFDQPSQFCKNQCITYFMLCKNNLRCTLWKYGAAAISWYIYTIQ